MHSPCWERERLQTDYIIAVQAFLKQVAALQPLMGREDVEPFREALARCEEQRVRVVETHRLLSRHWQEHGC